MSKLQIDLSGKGGLAPKFQGDTDRTVATPELRIIGEDNQMADGIYNPLRRYGYLSPSNAITQTMTFTGGTNDAIMGSSIYDIVNNDFYFAERKQQIWKGDGLDDTLLTRMVDLGATGTPIIMDLEIYQINGAAKLFYTYEKSGYVEIGHVDLGGAWANDNANWLSTDVTNPMASETLTNDVFMRIADNGLAYIFQDNYVHRVDGTTDGGATGTLIQQILTFPSNYQIIDAIDYRGRIYIAVHRDKKNVRTGEALSVYSSNVGIYVYDRDETIIDHMWLGGVRDLRKLYIAPTGELRLIVTNSERITEIKQFTGTTFKTIQEVGLAAYPLFIDALTTFSDFTVWLGYDGIIYAHGKPSFQDKEGIFKIGNLPEAISSSGMNTGAILFGGANTDSGSTGFKQTKNGLFLSYIDSSSNVDMVEWDLYGTGCDGVSATAERGDVFTLVKLLPQMSSINYIDIYGMRTGTGATTVATIKLYFNQNSTASITKTVTRNDMSRGYVRLEINKQYINAIQMEIEFASSAISSNDFAPSYAIVDYTPTKTKG